MADSRNCVRLNRLQFAEDVLQHITRTCADTESDNPNSTVPRLEEHQEHEAPVLPTSTLRPRNS